MNITVNITTFHAIMLYQAVQADGNAQCVVRYGLPEGENLARVLRGERFVAEFNKVMRAQHDDAPLDIRQASNMLVQQGDLLTPSVVKLIFPDEVKS